MTGNTLQYAFVCFTVVSILLTAFTGAYTGNAAAQSELDSVLSPTIDNDVPAFSIWGDEGVSEDVVRYGAEGHPSYLVTVDANKTSSLTEWANSSDQREVREWVDNDTALVVAPSEQVVNKGLISDSGLFTLSYVESVSYNLESGLIEPVEPAENDNVSSISNKFSRGEWGTGQATEANATDMALVRENIGSENVTEDGSGVTVGVIDTGLNYDSSLYGDRIQAGKNFINNTTIDKANGNYSAVADANGHGSWVASAIAGNGSSEYRGVAPGADLVVAKALADDGSGETADIVQAVSWTCERADVVSMSLGSPIYSEALDEAVTDCVDNGTVVVVAVGNSGDNPATMYVSSPADTPETGVLGVAASTNDNASEAQIASFSEVGPDRGVMSNQRTAGVSPDVAAPGMEITTEVATTDGQIENKTLSGTSMATPVVSGSVALLLQNNDLDPSNVQRRIEQTSEPMPNAGKYETQNGLVNAENLVTNTEVNESQVEVRNDQASARDSWYDAYSTSDVMRWLA